MRHMGDKRDKIDKRDERDIRNIRDMKRNEEKTLKIVLRKEILLDSWNKIREYMIWLNKLWYESWKYENWDI